MPAEPRDAATLILLRDSPSSGELQVLMVRRHVRSEFAADMNVFPGGSVEDEDLEDAGALLCTYGLEKGGGREMGCGDSSLGDLPLRLAAIRETFEETGILLARPAGEKTPSALEKREVLLSLRKELLEGGGGFTAMLKRAGLRPAVELLIPFARWITPEAMPIRFDARFYLAGAPHSQEPLTDGEEISGCVWVEPGQALRSCREGRFPMLPPTVANLRELASFNCVEDALAAARIKEIRKVAPRLVEEGGLMKLLFPGDPGYEGQR